MSYMVINEELRIQSCSIADLSQDQKEDISADLQAGIEELSMIYDPVTDTIILNQDHENFELYKLAAETFMKASSKRRSSIMSKIGCYGDDTNDMLDQIARRRERLQQEKQAREIRRILGEHPIDPYLKNVDMLGVIKQMHPDRYPIWDEYDTFMYGYIQGIRAERVRRKKVAL